jgi:hypothetical protein
MTLFCHRFPISERLSNALLHLTRIFEWSLGGPRDDDIFGPESIPPGHPTRPSHPAFT